MNDESVMRIELAAKLKRLRCVAGLSTREAANAAGFSQAKLSKIENANMLPSVLDVDLITRALEVKPAIAQSLRSDAIELNVASGRSVNGKNRVWYAKEMLEAELDASSCATAQWLTIPGILQTETFAEAQLGSLYEDIRSRMENRIARQQAARVSKCEFTFLIDQNAFYLRRFGLSVMIEQLQALERHIATGRYRIGVVPAEESVVDPSLMSPVVLDDEIAIAETLTALPIQGPAFLQIARQTIDRWSNRAQWGSDAFGLVRDTRRELQMIAS